MNATPSQPAPQPAYAQHARARAENSGAYGAIPTAPRTPVFARQAQPTPYGFTQPQQHNGYGQYGDLSAPPPPHSLAPVAMGAMSSERHFSSTHTGNTNRSNGTVVIREKPSLKWGVMIAVTGALLGGVLGLGMDARRQSARAAAAAEARDVAPPAMVATALPQAPAPVAAPVLPAARPAVVSSLAAPALPAQPAAVAAPVVIAPSAGVVVTAAKPDARVAKAAPPPAPAARHAAPPARPTVSFAAKVPQPKPEPVAKAEPAPKPQAVVKADKVEDKVEKSAKKDPSTKAAQDLLEQANKDTVNTL